VKLFSVILLSLTLAQAASAGTFAIHTVSRHIWLSSNHGNLNDINLGVSYENDHNIVVGADYNSFRKPSLFLAKDFQFGDHFSIYLGAVSGYTFDQGIVGKTLGVLPMVSLGIHLTEHVSLVTMANAVNLTFQF